MDEIEGRMDHKIKIVDGYLFCFSGMDLDGIYNSIYTVDLKDLCQNESI
jgi:hypothetical protein